MEKVINGFEDYIINDSGINERSVWSKKRNQWVKPRPMPNGYVHMCFSKEGKHYHKYLHRLIAEAFIPNPENKPEIDHINGVRNDNRVENLRWATKTENMNNPLTIRKLQIKPIAEETKAKIAESLMGRFCGEKNPNFGKHLTEEQKAKISAANKGKCRSAETIAKMSDAMKCEKNPLFGKHHSTETKDKMSEAMKAYWANNKPKTGKDNHSSIPIVQLTMDGEFVRQWACAADVGRELGINHTSISACCRGIYKSSGGFRWMRLSEYQKRRTPIDASFFYENS